MKFRDAKQESGQKDDKFSAVKEKARIFVIDALFNDVFLCEGL